tara:strand:- start:1083 stop:1556 length:474 start_codon:yes stop_codon:yes gene_type:complete
MSENKPWFEKNKMNSSFPDYVYGEEATPLNLKTLGRINQPRSYPNRVDIEISDFDLKKIDDSWLEHLKNQKPISLTQLAMEGQQRRLEHQVLEAVSGGGEIAWKEVQRIHHVDVPMKYLLVYKGQTLGMISFDTSEENIYNLLFRSLFDPEVKSFEV